MFLKHDNKYYQELNYKMMNSYLTHELKQFIYDLAFQETERLYAILQTKYPTQFKARGFMKEGKTPDYLKLNNPTNEIRDPIRRDGTKIMSDRDVDDEILRSIIDDLLQLPVVPTQPTVVLPKSSGNELEDLRKQIADLTKLVQIKNTIEEVAKAPIPTIMPEAKPTISAVDTVQTSTSSEKIEFTNPVNPRVAEAAIAAVEADVEAGINTIVEEIIDAPLTTDDEGSIQ